jgi:Fe2+ transport system protein B
MSTAQQQRPSVDIAALAAALGSNVVPFVPSPPRDEPEPSNAAWAEGLELIDQAAAFLRTTEQRAAAAEERSEKVAVKAMEGLRAAQQRFEQAEAHAHEVERQAAEQIKAAEVRVAEAEGWAQAAEERARAAESRIEEAEVRARNAEEWLRCLTDALRQKLTFRVDAELPEEPSQAPKRARAG